MIPAHNRHGVVQKQVDPHTTTIHRDGRIKGSSPMLWVEPDLYAKVRAYPPREAPAPEPAPELEPWQIYGGETISTAKPRTRPDPAPKGRRPAPPPPQPPYEPHKWTEIGTDLADGTAVHWGGAVVGHVEAGTVRAEGRAADLIRRGVLTAVDGEGRLK
ncbi:hypothetical protein [Falsiruegeria mediterranea]